MKWVLLIMFVILSPFGSRIYQSCDAYEVPYSSSLSDVEIMEPFGLCHAGYSGSYEEMTMLQNLGSKWMRVDFSWQGIEAADDVFDYSYWDSYVQSAENYGRNIMAILDYSVSWLTKSKSLIPDGQYIHPDDIPYFLDYVNTTVRRYKQNVTAWEIWNEPNGDGFWRGTDDEFFLLFNATQKLINGIDPNLVIVGAAVAGHDPNYIENMFKANIMEFVDVVSFHPYSSNVNEVYSKILEVKAIGKKYGFIGDYWITEVGNPTGGTYGHRVDLDAQSDRIIKTMTYSVISNLSCIIWYCLFDASDASKQSDPMNSELYFGISYPNSTWKPGAYAFSLFSNLTSNSTYIVSGCEVQSVTWKTSIKSFLFKGSDNSRTLILWFDNQINDQSNIEIALEHLQNSTDLIGYDITTGQPAIMTDSKVTLSNTPMVISFTSENADPFITIFVNESMELWIYLVGFPFLLGISIFLSIKKSKRN